MAGAYFHGSEELFGRIRLHPSSYLFSAKISHIDSIEHHATLRSVLETPTQCPYWGLNTTGLVFSELKLSFCIFIVSVRELHSNIFICWIPSHESPSGDILTYSFRERNSSSMSWHEASTVSCITTQRFSIKRGFPSSISSHIFIFCIPFGFHGHCINRKIICL